MKAEKHFDRLPKEDRQLIALKIAKALHEYLQLFISRSSQDASSVRC